MKHRPGAGIWSVPRAPPGRFSSPAAPGRDYGLVGPEGDRRQDIDASFDAGTRLTQANAQAIEQITGRPATYQDLAVAHQQGLGGTRALHEGRLPPGGNLAVNRLDPRGGAAGVRSHSTASMGSRPAPGLEGLLPALGRTLVHWPTRGVLQQPPSWGGLLVSETWARRSPLWTGAPRAMRRRSASPRVQARATRLPPP